MTELNVQSRGVSDLIPYAANSRTHSEAQIAQIAASIKEFGWTNPILIDGDDTIIAGHGRLLAARKLGMEEVPVIVLDHLTKSQQRALVIADNQLALNAGWDMEMLKAEIDGLKFDNFDIELLGFSDNELDEIFNDAANSIDTENPYTDKVKTPVYEPNGPKPSIDELYNNEKSNQLINAIEESSLDNEEKQFLRLAAARHIVFNYSKIANFYAHSSAECQKLMEDSALVIIDFGKAIENGFVRLTDEINNMFSPEAEGEDE